MKYIFQSAFLVLAGVSMAAPAAAQQFSPSIDNLSYKTDSYVVKTDGTRIDGTVNKFAGKVNQFKKIIFKDTDGKKHKINAIDIEVFANKPGGLAKGLAAMDQAASSAVNASNTDFSQILKRDYVYFRQALLPGGKNKTALVQLVNPGFDARIQVFADPKGRETMSVGIGGVNAVGGMAKSYLIVKDGGQAEYVKKKGYADQLEWMFGDCDAVGSEASLAEPNWKDLPTRVAIYEQACGTK
jgi:hypothetical protein